MHEHICTYRHWFTAITRVHVTFSQFLFHLLSIIRNPRALMYNPDTEDPRRFHLTFLQMIKKDLVHVQLFTKERLALDAGPPRIENMPVDQQRYYHSKQTCDFCGRKFGSTYTCKLQGKLIKGAVIKHFDHSAFFFSPLTFSHLYP